MRSNDLRKAIRAKLLTLPAVLGVTGVYYRLADPAAVYPHIVFTLSSAITDDYAGRSDYTVDIDIFTKFAQADNENIADAVEDLFFYANDPQTTILPTFFREGRTEIDDPDKTIRRTLVRMTAQVYEEPKED